MSLDVIHNNESNANGLCFHVGGFQAEGWTWSCHKRCRLCPCIAAFGLVGRWLLSLSTLLTANVKERYTLI